jgi:ankyrin repeat protein
MRLFYILKIVMDELYKADLYNRIIRAIKSLRPRVSKDPGAAPVFETRIDPDKVGEILRLIDTAPDVNYIPPLRPVNSRVNYAARHTGTYTSLLLTACEYGATVIINKLLQKGADVNQANNAGHTPLHYVCEREFLDSDPIYIIGELIKKDANVNATTLVHNETPLAAAVMRGVDTRIIKKLLDNGARLDILPVLENKERSILELAIIVVKTPNYKPNIKLLLEYGAIPSLDSSLFLGILKQQQ